MADLRSVVPYHDPHDTPLDIFDYLNCVTDPNPNLMNLSSMHETNNNNIADPNDPFDDPMVWNLFNESSNDKILGEASNAAQEDFNQAGPLQIHGETSYARQEQNSQQVHLQGADLSQTRGETSNGRQRHNSQPPNLDGGIPISVWPPPPVPFQCTCCLVLREIVHTDGSYTTKLEIHGRLGMICHAIFLAWDHTRGPATDSQKQMFDFGEKSIHYVRQFLQHYCDNRRTAGYVMVRDPLSMFYGALCVGLEWYRNLNRWDENLNNDDFGDPSPTNSGERHMDQSEWENETERLPKSNLAQQRERAGRLTLRDFVDYFHLPIEEAARRLNLCPTVVKKICRRDGMHRWPHRKIKSLQRQISILESNLSSNDEDERARAQAEIQRLQEELKIAYTGATR